MAPHTTFRTGGPAEYFFRPADHEDLRSMIQFCVSTATPWFVLGGGANILVSDRGIPGVVIDMSALGGIRAQGTRLFVEAGTPVSQVSAFAADAGLAGFEFIYSMPGSFGGAVWMNARCYDAEIGDVLREVHYLDESGSPMSMIPQREEFRYKDTPFMKNRYTILSAVLELQPTAESAKLWAKMRGYEADRRSKGHFMAPCAGSIFKNDRNFGAPTGRIIDRLGLRGTKLGGAQISPLHANIILNTGDARSSDIRDLIVDIQKRVEAAFGFRLEPEVLLVGDWT